MTGLMGLKTAAAYLDIHRSTLQRWVQANCGPPSIVVGKRRYFRRDIIDQWFKARSLI